MKKLLLIIAILCVIATPLISASYGGWSISHAYTQQIGEEDDRIDYMYMSQTNSFEFSEYYTIADEVDSTLFVLRGDDYEAYFNTGEHLNFKDNLYVGVEGSLENPYMTHWISSLSFICDFDDECEIEEDDDFCPDCGRMEYLFPTVQASTVSEVSSTANLVYLANEDAAYEVLLYADDIGSKSFEIMGDRNFINIFGEGDEIYYTMFNHDNGRCYQIGYNDGPNKYFISYIGTIDNEWSNQSTYILSYGRSVLDIGYDTTGNIWTLEYNDSNDDVYLILYDEDLERLDALYLFNYEYSDPLHSEEIYGEYFEIEDDSYITGYSTLDLEEESVVVVLKSYQEVNDNIVLQDSLSIDDYLIYDTYHGLNEEEDETYLFIPGLDLSEGFPLLNIFPTVQAEEPDGGLDLKIIRYDYDTNSFELVLEDSTVFGTYFNEGKGAYPDFMTYDVRNDQLLVGISDFVGIGEYDNYVYVFDLNRDDLFSDFWNGILYHSFDVYLAVLGEFFFGMFFGFIGAGIYVNNRNYSTITTYLVLVGVFFAIIMPTHIVGVFGIILAFLIGAILFKSFVDK